MTVPETAVCSRDIVGLSLVEMLTVHPLTGQEMAFSGTVDGVVRPATGHDVAPHDHGLAEAAGTPMAARYPTPAGSRVAVVGAAAPGGSPCTHEVGQPWQRITAVPISAKSSDVPCEPAPVLDHNHHTPHRKPLCNTLTKSSCQSLLGEVVTVLTNFHCKILGRKQDYLRFDHLCLGKSGNRPPPNGVASTCA
jgi:hypothetical protein